MLDVVSSVPSLGSSPHHHAYHQQYHRQSLPIPDPAAVAARDHHFTLNRLSFDATAIAVAAASQLSSSPAQQSLSLPPSPPQAQQPLHSSPQLPSQPSTPQLQPQYHTQTPQFQPLPAAQPQQQYQPPQQQLPSFPTTTTQQTELYEAKQEHQTPVPSPQLSPRSEQLPSPPPTPGMPAMSPSTYPHSSPPAPSVLSLGNSAASPFSMSVFMSPLRSSHTPSEKSNSKSSGGKGSASKAFQCLHPGCDKKFTRLQNLKSHLDCHTGVRNFPCDECNARFRRKQDLQRHRRTMHSEAKLHRCPNCDKEFARADALKRHMQSKSRIHACPGNLANAGKNGATVSPSSAPGNVNVNASAAAATPSPAAVSAAAMAAFAPSHNHMAVSAAAAANLQSMQSIQNMQNMQNMQNLQTMQRMQNLQNIQNMHVRGIAAPNSMSALVSSSQLPPMTLQSSLAAANLQAQQVSNMTFPTVASHTIPSNVPSSPPASLPSLTDPDSPNATAY